MEAITSQWNDWNENAKISISLPCYIEQIVTYPASYQSFNYWKYKLKKAREKLICQDCVVVDKDGDKLRKEFSTWIFNFWMSRNSNLYYQISFP